MTEWQINLLILGGVAIGLVYVFNLFQERGFRKKTQQAFAKTSADVLLVVPKNNVRDGRLQRLEPVLLEPANAVGVLQENACATDKTVCSSDSEVAVLDVADRQAVVAAMLDPTLDFICEVIFEQACTLGALPHFNVSKRVQMIACTEKNVWKTAEGLPAGKYKQVNIGLQLVDRGGALTEAELTQFCQQVGLWAEQYHGVVSFPRRQQKLSAAYELDCFCEKVDVLIGINIVTQTPIGGARLRSFVESNGLQLEPDGAFHYLSDSGNSLYSLVAADQTSFTLHNLLTCEWTSLSLLFDVPRVAGGVAIFDRAIFLARQLAGEFNAQLVDDNRRVLSDGGLARIREQLTVLYRSMDDHGIAPGSVAALRLFA